MTRKIAHTQAGVPDRRRHRLPWPWLVALVLFVGLSGPAFSGCEDDVVAPPPPPAPAGGGGRKKGKAGPAASLVESGVILPEEDVPLRGAQDDPIPEPDANSVWGWIFVKDPLAALRLYGDLTGDRVNVSELAGELAQLYGLDALAAVDWSKPALLAFVSSLDAPVLVLSVTQRDEFLTPMPRNAIPDRQGNEYSYPLSMTATLYLNFLAGEGSDDGRDKAILTSDWRQFPLARVRLTELLAAEQPRLVQASFRVAAFDGLNARIARLEAPAPAFNAGWTDVRATLEVLAGDLDTVSLSLGRDASGVLLDAQLGAREGSPLLGLLGTPSTADPRALLGRIAGLPLRQWLWMDVRRPPLTVDGLVAPFVSTVADLPAAAAVLGKLELAGVQALDGAVLRARIGAGESRHELALAAIKDEAAYRQLVRDRHAALATLPGVKRGEAAAAEVATAEAPPEAPTRVLATLTFAPGEGDAPTQHVVDGLSQGVSWSVRGPAPEPIVQHVPSGSVAWPEAFDALVGTPWVLLAADLGGADDPPSSPVLGALTASATGLSLFVRIPEEQLERLR